MVTTMEPSFIVLSRLSRCKEAIPEELEQLGEIPSMGGRFPMRSIPVCASIVEITGDTFYNSLKIGELETEKEDRPVDPPVTFSVEYVQKSKEEVTSSIRDKRRVVDDSEDEKEERGEIELEEGNGLRSARRTSCECTCRCTATHSFRATTC